MIRVPSQNGGCAIQLFGQHDPRETVWQRECAEIEHECGPRENSRTMTIRTTDQKREFRTAIVAAFADMGRKMR